MSDAAPDFPAADRRLRLRAPRVVRREVALDALPPDVWDAAVAAAERAFGRRGTLRGAEEPCWRAAPVGGRAEVLLCALMGDGDARVVGEWTRPVPRPVVAASAFLFVPFAGLVAFLLWSQSSPLVEWVVVAALLAVPVVVAVWMEGLAWIRAGRARRRLRDVMAAAAHASRVAVPARAPILAPDPDPAGDLDALPVPAPSEWLTDDEIAALASRDARIPRARAVAAATAERTSPRAAEWL